ncbi:MAG: hypothetical protein NVSMB62_30050 [Acidobacteriaceae bacterium]
MMLPCDALPRAPYRADLERRVPQDLPALAGHIVWAVGTAYELADRLSKRRLRPRRVRRVTQLPNGFGIPYIDYLVTSLSHGTL